MNNSFGAWQRSAWHLPIDFATMAHFYDSNAFFIIIYKIDNAIGSLPNSVSYFPL